jgi:D-alanyl-D-alanine carboxypeptidase
VTRDTHPGVAERLTAIFDRVRASHAQGIAAVESLDGSFRWRSGGPSHASYFIASIDKLLDATIALLLVERGQLDLTAPVTRYLPASLLAGLHVVRGVDRSDQIAVQHLLSHTSGLPDWLEDRPSRGRSAVDQVLGDGDRAIGLEQMLTIVRGLEAHFRPQPDGPRARARYSNTNFTLLTAIIEVITGQSLPDVHRDFLHRPLGMRHTYFLGRSAPLEPAPAPLTLRAGGEPVHLPRLLESIGSVYSTLDDMLTFLRALVSGGIFVQPSTFELMRRDWRRFGVPLDRAAIRAPSWPIEYSRGMMRFQLPRLFTAFRRVPPVIGHSGSTGTWLFYCEEQEMLFAGTVEEITAGAVPYRVVPKQLRVTQRLRTDAGRSW